MTEATVGLESIFPPLDQAPASLEKGEQVIPIWRDTLFGVIKNLGVHDHIHPLSATAAAMAVDVWETHPDHGALHSYFLYEGERTLNQAGETTTPVSDSLMQAGAVLHDFAQILPLQDPKTGRAVNGNQRVLHAQTMAYIVRQFGKTVGLSLAETNELAFGIRRHDDVFAGIMHPNMPYSAKLLSDADHMFGAGLERDPKEMVVATLLRSRKGSYKNTGWHLLRPLTFEQRRNWTYGRRWNADGITAVLHEIYGLKYYTDIANQLSLEKRAVFPLAADIVYGGQFDAHKQLVDQWLQEPRAPVRLVGFNQKPRTVKGDVQEIIDTANGLPFDIPDMYKVEGYTPAGWMIEVDLKDNQTLLIDPSIGEFVLRPGGREQFLREISFAQKMAAHW